MGMKVWITKYALTQGILERSIRSFDDETAEDITGGHLRAKYYYKGEWHESKISAIAKAEEMRKKKISSLKKQIEKLEKIKFE